MPSSVSRPSCVLPPCAVKSSMPGRSWAWPLPATTPGASCSTSLYERDVGSVWRMSPSITCWRRALRVSTIGDSPVTVTVSCRSPTRSSVLMLAVTAAVSWMFSCRTVLKPGKRERQRVGARRQGRRCCTGHCHRSATERTFSISAELAASTVTPGSTRSRRVSHGPGNCRRVLGQAPTGAKSTARTTRVLANLCMPPPAIPAERLFRMRN